MLENREEFYEAFPEGSLYSRYGVQTASVPQDLKELIDRLDESDDWLRVFHRELNNCSSLEMFEDYWGRAREGG